MASNSDSVYHVLSHMRSNKDNVHQLPLEYTNVVTMHIPDTVKVDNSLMFFPDQRLRVNRLEPAFVAKNGELLDYFYNMTKQEIPNYHDVWITTSHIVTKQAYLIELSFE